MKINENEVARTESEYKSGNFKYISEDVIENIQKREKELRKRESIERLRNGAKIRVFLFSLSICMLIFTKIPVVISLSPILVLILLAILFSWITKTPVVDAVVGLLRFIYPDDYFDMPK